uniref:MIP18 family-like domain-containing protein n=1 Tax=Kalanchoe fedtschenkoi TaxID=63787 RepID=A0A7N0T919_KALFE
MTLDMDAAVDPLEIYDILRDIKDPEFPSSLGELNVITDDSVAVDEKTGHILITFTPTVPHCHLANIIGLCIRAKLNSHLSLHHKVSHQPLESWNLIVTLCTSVF